MQATQSAQKGEKERSLFIPYSNHITKSIIKTHEGDFVITIRLQGAAHESADIQDLNVWQEQINGLLRNISSPHIALWTHIVRRKFDRYPAGKFKVKFADELNEKYKESIMANNLFINELYLSIIYRPDADKVSSFLSKFGSKKKAELISQQQDAIDILDEYTEAALTSLSRYEPVVLGCYEHKNNLFSEPLQLYSFLIDGEWHRFPLPRTEINNVLATSRPFFGKGGAIAFKTPSGSHHAASLAIQEYPSYTYGGVLNELLTVPFPLVISQSFTFLSKQAAVGRMTRQQDRMLSAGDVAVSQIADIGQALDDIVSNRFVLGSHHLSIVLRSEDSKKLMTSISSVGAILSDVGMKWTRETLHHQVLCGRNYQQILNIGHVLQI